MDEKTLFTIIITYLGIMSLILFLMMGIDKAKAKQGARRISEKSLFTVAALGGGIGMPHSSLVCQRLLCSISA